MYNLGSYGWHDSQLQLVSMQKRIVQDSSKGETTEKERNISILLPGVYFQ